MIPVDVLTQQFTEDGYLVVPQILNQNELREWKIFAKQHFEDSFKILYQNGHTRAPHHQDDRGEYVLGFGAKHGFREIVMRSPGRYELSLLNHPKEQMPDSATILKSFEDLLPKLLGDSHSGMDSMKLCHLSLLVATPGSSDQSWHADGGHVSIETHLPCHCFNVVVPLQDVPLEMGPTEFRPGGHILTRNLGPMMLAAKCRKTLRPPVWPALTLGDAVLWDYRVLHRGRANKTDANRNLLVLTYCEPWFEDVLNFPKRTMNDQAHTTS